MRPAQAAASRPCVRIPKTTCGARVGASVRCWESTAGTDHAIHVGWGTGWRSIEHCIFVCVVGMGQRDGGIAREGGIGLGK